MRTLIALFLTLIFACQALPVAALGKLCGKAQMTLADDDHPADADDDDDAGPAPDEGKSKKETKSCEDVYLHPGPMATVTGAIGRSPGLVLHSAAHLPPSFTGEVATPPPDHC